MHHRNKATQTTVEIRWGDFGRAYASNEYSNYAMPAMLLERREAMEGERLFTGGTEVEHVCRRI